MQRKERSVDQKEHLRTEQPIPTVPLIQVLNWAKTLTLCDDAYDTFVNENIDMRFNEAKVLFILTMIIIYTLFSNNLMP